MSYYPILKAPYCTGKTTLYNFPPNNWEGARNDKKVINLSYIDDGLWHSVELGELSHGDYQIINYQDVKNLVPDNALPLLSLTRNKLEKKSEELPKLAHSETNVPQYRSTLGLVSKDASTSYQGEINYFPLQASLLTFAPFLQFGVNIENYVLLINLEKVPQNRLVELEVYDAHSKLLRKTQTIHGNQINIISLDDMEFDNQSLPVIICRDMAFIPLFFSCADQGRFLSIEHTHPPASMVVHGSRFSAQNYLKEYWFSQCKK
jgi:hypothetical protein